MDKSGRGALLRAGEMDVEMSSRPSTSLETTDRTSTRMSRQARRDTRPELEIRRRIHRLGYRYRVNHPLPGLPRRRADLTFTPKRVVVFVDGCFWHACPEHATSPKNNGAWWAEKLKLNVERDRETDGVLRLAGWNVIRIWEHEDPDLAVHRVVEALTAGTQLSDCT
jgi:DNA mismatch endonuclease (patch repair protein)